KGRRNAGLCCRNCAVVIRSLRRWQGERFGFRSGRHDRRLLLALVEDQLVALDRDLADQPADNDVLLDTLERVDLAVAGSFRALAGGILDGGRREEGAGLQARL